ncbi:MAG: PEP-CTERM sorting domain-containing protein [Fimbriimonadaceae bacterium]|nr:PEP-CTERM sorting domain-containing protein [Fimbriimonadaceae bacterium]
MKLQLVALACVVAPLASASLTNASFEEPPQSLGAYSSDGIDGWTKSSSGSAGVWHLPAGSFFETDAPDGVQIGYSNALFIAQQASDVLGLGTTNLSVMGGRRTDGFAGSFMLRLWAGGTVADGVVTDGTLLGETLYDHTAHDPTSFSLVKIEYEALAGDASLGKLLTVQFERTAGSQMDFDDVRLSAESVPEPATLLALGAGVLSLARRRRP